MSEKTFSLTDNATGKAVQLKGYAGTMGPDVIDVRSIYAQDGRFTYDPGFASTASCESAITFIDGEQGLLLYRGYPVEQLAAKSSFIIHHILAIAPLTYRGPLVKKVRR